MESLWTFCHDLFLILFLLISQPLKFSDSNSII